MKKIVIVLAVLCLMSVGAFAQCATLPCVVATTSLIKQTHGIAPTTVFTPTEEGTFRVSAYLTTSKPTNPDAGDWELYFRWNDGLRANRWVENTASNPALKGDDPTTPLSHYWSLFNICENKDLYLLTATPINNRLLDLQHMIELFSRRVAFVRSSCVVASS